VSATTQQPVEARAKKKSKGGADQRTAEKAHSTASQIEKMTERQDIGVGILAEEIYKLDARRWRVRNYSQGTSNPGDQQAKNQENGSGNTAAARDVRTDRRCRLAREPVAK